MDYGSTPLSKGDIGAKDTSGAKSKNRYTGARADCVKGGGEMVKGARQIFSLRPMGLADVERIAPWFLDFEDVSLFERNFPVPVSPEHIHETWKSALKYAEPPSALWYIAEDENREPAGVCGLQSINYIHGDAIVPIFVGSKMRGKGLAQAIAVPVIDLGFQHLRLHRLTTFIREDNHATRAITAKLGFVEEGCLRQAAYSNGVHKDMIQVGLLKSDWISMRSSVTEKLEKSSNISINMRHAYQ